MSGAWTVLFIAELMLPLPKRVWLWAVDKALDDALAASPLIPVRW